MKHYSLGEVHEALKFGDKHGFDLFPEVKHMKNSVKLQTLSSVKHILGELKEVAHHSLTSEITQIPFQKFIAYRESGNRKEYENAYFSSRKDLFALLILEIYEGQSKYIEAIENYLWAWCSMYSWELPAHIDLSDIAGRTPDCDKKDLGLFAAETGFFFAEALYFLRNQLHPFLYETIMSQINARIIIPYEMNIYTWESEANNWASVCSGSIGAIAIYCMKDTQKLSTIIHRVLLSMECYLESFDEDGITAEGVYYWCYGFGFYVYFAQLLLERTSGKLNLFEDERIRKIANMPLWMQFPDGKIIAYSDCGSDYIELNPGLLHLLEQKYHQSNSVYFKSPKPHVFFDPTYRFAVMIRDLFWQQEIKKSEIAQDISNAKFFVKSQWAIYQQHKNDAFYCFAAKGGHNDEPHNHNDIGNFILHANGETYIEDLGAPEYTRDYFDHEKRYLTFEATSGAHNVPIIDGCEQRPGREFKGDIKEMTDTKEYFIYSLELHKAYEASGLMGFTRTWIVDKHSNNLVLKDRFQIEDNFEHNKQDGHGHHISECFISRNKPSSDRPGSLYINTISGTLEMKFDPSLKVRIEEISTKNHQGESKIVYRTQLVIEKVGRKVEYESGVECESESEIAFECEFTIIQVS